MEGTKEYWSMTEGVFNCLIDEERTKAFKKAIFNTVRKGDIVVDIGTGSGIFAMFAADAGAKTVYAVELDEKNYWNLENNFKINGYQDKIILIKGDARKVKLPEKVDVIIGEMIATGLIEEQQIPAMNNILKFAKKRKKVLIKNYQNFIDLVHNKENYYGKKMKIVRYEYTGIDSVISQLFSEKIRYADVDFTKINRNNKINKKINFKIKKSGLINGIRISSKTIFSDDSSFDFSFAYSYPIILPIEETTVKKNDQFLVQLDYEMCAGFGNLKYSIKRA